MLSHRERHSDQETLFGSPLGCRPGHGPDWHAILRHRVLKGVAGCRGQVVVHTGSWRHDLDQARCLPTQAGLKVQVGGGGAGLQAGSAHSTVSGKDVHGAEGPSASG